MIEVQRTRLNRLKAYYQQKNYTLPKADTHRDALIAVHSSPISTGDTRKCELRAKKNSKTFDDSTSECDEGTVESLGF